MAPWKITLLTLTAVAVFYTLYFAYMSRREARVGLILRLLKEKGEASAVELVQASNGQLSLKTTYPLLRSMEREGLIISREDYEGADLEARGGRPRILYCIRGNGHRVRGNFDSPMTPDAA